MSSLDFPVGSTVEIFGLQSEAGRHFNGYKSRVKRFDAMSSRYILDVETGDEKSIRADNLRRLNGSATAQNTTATPNAASADPWCAFATAIRLPTRRPKDR